MCDAGESCALSSGVREEAMGWTMTVRDDLGVIAWTRRAGNHLSLFLLLSLFSLSVQSDVAFPREDRFSWKAGKMPSLFLFFYFYFCCTFPLLFDNVFHLGRTVIPGGHQCSVEYICYVFFAFKCKDLTSEPSLNPFMAFCLLLSHTHASYSILIANIHQSWPFLLLIIVE